jgi:UDP-N-acetylmuramate dehydrogenase
MLNKIQQIDDFTIKAEAGVSLPQLVKYCISQGMVDVAFLAGIPGSVGGAMAMNAGACGDEIWNHIIAAECINRHGKIETEKASRFVAQYRSVLGLESNEWFVAGHFVFPRSTPEAAKAKVQEYFSKRKVTQPLAEATCGSVFRNPPDKFAGKLIEECGLKGMRIGGARVSEKHANFIVNEGNASASDIENLINYIVSKVFKQCGVTLVPEVHIIGEKNVSI